MKTKGEKSIHHWLGESWYRQLGELILSNDGMAVLKKVSEARKGFGAKVYPKKEEVFNAFKYTQFENIRVVIVGTAPTNMPDASNGLAFSSRDPFAGTPEGKAIAKELEDTIYNGLQLVYDENLVRWAIQDVLLLSTHLTSAEGNIAAHADYGWPLITSKALELLIKREEPIVFLLWGMEAQRVYQLAEQVVGTPPMHHLVLRAEYPSSPEGFIGKQHFALTNKFLEKNYNSTIEW
jgi:uracil-DNA glycosylase